MRSTRSQEDVPRGMAWFDSPWRIAGAALSIAATVVLLMVVVTLFAIPRALGGASLTVLSGSMEPTFAPGDVVVVRGIDEADVCDRIGIGEIVTYLPEPGSPDLITHRVVGKTIGMFDDGAECRLVVRGDANGAADAPVSPAQVRGQFMYGIPNLGWIRQWVQQNPMVVVVAAGAIVIAHLAWTASRPRRLRVVAYHGAPVPQEVNHWNHADVLPAPARLPEQD